MADYINFLSGALETNMVSCYRLKWVEMGLVGSEEKGEACKAHIFSFLQHWLVVSFLPQ
jgi:hypothetical protein